MPPREIVGADMETATGGAGEFGLPAELRQVVVSCAAADKPLMVHVLVERLQLARVLVFVHSNESVHRSGRAGFVNSFAILFVFNCILASPVTPPPGWPSCWPTWATARASCTAS